RSFQESWTSYFGFVSRDERAVCALCCQSVVCRTSSIKRHFETKHEKSFKDDAEKRESLKKASFTDGVFVKEAFLGCAEVLFGDLPNKSTIISRIKDLPVSARTVERRITDMATDITEQQSAALKAAEVFSVALDESVDINDSPRLAVVARYCSNGEIHEELCCLKSMNGSTKGEDVLNTFINHFEQRDIDIKNIFLITTDGAPAMVGMHLGFVTLAEQIIGHPVMKLHCIIHQENLCAKISDSELNDVMSTVTKIVNFLVARSAKTHRQFRSLL
uniref:DUF4371 domain-containing protein n=1 Tax=Ciona savignyi TaxID=51511 RepID=H2Z3U0_CIOSA